MGLLLVAVSVDRISPGLGASYGVKMVPARRTHCKDQVDRNSRRHLVAVVAVVVVAVAVAVAAVAVEVAVVAVVVVDDLKS